MLHFDEIEFELVRKDIRRINLRVYPPAGRVRISAPRRMELEVIRAFAESKLDWIRSHQARIRAQMAAQPIDIADGLSPLERRRRQARLDLAAKERVLLLATPLLAHWEQVMGVKAARLSVRRMKTRWGSCNVRTRTIRLNSELAHAPVEGLEYVLVHELVHLLEPSHNARFKALMDRNLPAWREHRQRLNDSVKRRPGGTGLPLDSPDSARAS